VFFRLLSMHSRHVHFNDHVVKNSLPYRGWKALKRLIKPGSSYENTDQPIPQQLWQEIEKILGKDVGALRPRTSASIGLSVDSLRRSDEFMVPLAAAFLSQGKPVQYTTCLRHPFEFAAQLKEHWDKHYASTENWASIAAKCFLVVDAYTHHFGFSDSIHRDRSKELVNQGVQYILSPPSYAGVHTDASGAFNRIKKAHPDKRPATLLVYEGSQALVDLESKEQYHIFVRHVIPSERMWGGMLTMFVECGVDDKDLAVLRSYTDVFRKEQLVQVADEASSKKEPASP